MKDDAEQKTEGSFVCEQCGRKFQTRQALAAHVRFHKTTANPCPECSRTFASPQALSLHRWRAHRIKGNKRGKKAAPGPEGVKRRYTRRAKLEPVSAETPEFPNYCPQCGFRLHAIVAAMNFAKGV